MPSSKGYRAGSRKLLKKKIREHGKVGLSRLLHEYEPESNVVIKIDSSMQKGMPHRRFHGKTGKIVKKRGRSYVVSVSQGNSVKEIVVRPEHLNPAKGS